MFLLKFQQAFQLIKSSKIIVNHFLYKKLFLEIQNQIQKVKNLSKKGLKFLEIRVLFL